MAEADLIEPLLLVALVILAALLITKIAKRFHVPATVGFVLFGVALRLLDGRAGIVSPASATLLEFLGEIGVAALLFRVGLESDLGKLVAQLPTAVVVWVGDVVVSALLGFAGAYALGLGTIPSLFVAVILSATSIGLTVAVWQDERRLDTPQGALLIDVAELDDLSAVLLAALLLVAAPALHASQADASFPLLLPALGTMSAKFVGFGVACWLFSRYLEAPLSRLFVHDHPEDKPGGPTAVIFLVGVCFAIAALAGFMGLSVAVGALFAGLMFSRDPEAVRAESSFEPIHALFTPFFFLDIGFAVSIENLAGAVGLGLALLVPAVLGKVLGNGGIVALQGHKGWRAGLLMGVSMIPRAEIALVVARLGNHLGEWAVPDRLYGAIVTVSVTTALLSPLLLQRLFTRWPTVVPPSTDN